MLGGSAPVTVGTATLTLTLLAANDSGSQHTGTTGTDTLLGTATANFKYGATFFFYCGLRFVNATIPPGSTITSAALKLTNRTITYILIDCVIQGFKGTSIPVFVSGAGNQVGSRTVLSDTVVWTGALVHTASNTSPPLKTIIQQIITQSGWATGDTLGLRLHFTSSLKVASFANYGAAGPKLAIAYTV